MAAYHQMGHDSWNLVADGNLGPFGGLILSPVNNTPGETAERLQKLGLQLQMLEVILDPQLYKPQSERGCLTEWGHFPTDMDTADMSSTDWWAGICAASVKAALDLKVNAVCSPVDVPKQFDDDYFSSIVERGDATEAAADGSGISTLMTCIVSLAQLTKKGQALHIASILTRSRCRRAYLVLHDDLSPKSQRKDHEGLIGAMQLIHALQKADMEVMVPFSGIDMALWKAAGAAHVATGKFFNLRRFTKGRWDDPVSGGLVVPYWTEFGMFTWLRELDARLLNTKDMLDKSTAALNPYSMEIMKVLQADEKNEKWVGLSWRQYLYEFSLREQLYASLPEQVETDLVQADKRWGNLEAEGVLLFERENDGSWIRPWINAVRQWKKW